VLAPGGNKAWGQSRSTPTHYAEGAHAPTLLGRAQRQDERTLTSRRGSVRNISSTMKLGSYGHRAISLCLEPPCRGSLLETLPAGTTARRGQDRDDMPLPIGSATTERCWSKRYGSWTDQSIELKKLEPSSSAPERVPT